MKEELSRYSDLEGISIRGALCKDYSRILTPAAVKFIAGLQREFNQTREYLLQRRVERQLEIDEGKLPDFLIETENVRKGDWKIADVPKEIESRCVEITGPVDRKMVINALNSGAEVYMADFEDSHSPTWKGTMEGQLNLMDAVRKTITYETPQKNYRLNENPAVLMVRPRGWHLEEKHVMVDGKKMSASLFDFGLFFYHNANALLEKGSNPYFYLPKMESHLEARLWNDVFNYAQDQIGLQRKTIKATCLIETILAAFEMDEILYELKDHSAGLNCGRWDYIFSFIKKFRNHPEFILPDRDSVTMETDFMKSYVKLLINTCHKRGAHAMGGMAAQIPIKNNDVENDKAMERVVRDKKREVYAGHDETWVAHPGLVTIARKAFKNHMHDANQLDALHDDLNISASDLLKVPNGEITEAGLWMNTDVGIQYTESWLRGIGCVPLYNKMEDAATVEISSAQNSSWIKHNAKLNDGRKIDASLQNELIERFLNAKKEELGLEKFESSKFSLAAKLFSDRVTSKDFVEFLTIPAYEYL